MKTTIQKWGNSQGIRIPKVILDTLKWRENEKVMILVQDSKLIIEKAEEEEKKKTIEELFENFEGEYEPIKIDWGTPKGDEIW